MCSVRRMIGGAVAAILILAIYSVLLAEKNDNHAGNLYQSLPNNEPKVLTFAPDHESHLPSEMLRYLCGDANGDGNIDIRDVVFLCSYIFREGQAPDPLESADVDECGNINAEDPVYLMEFLFQNGPPPCEGSDTCYLPAGGNTITIGCPLTAYGHTGDSVAIPVYLTSDQPLNGFSLGFCYNSEYIEISSVDLTGSVIPSADFIQHNVWPGFNPVLVGRLIVEPSQVPIDIQDNGLLFNLWIQVPLGTQAQSIDIDSAFVIPAGEFVLIPMGGGAIKPNYVDCGREDIAVIYPDYICGDANSDETVNINDAVHIISYVFAGGTPPDPLESGDANCDEECNVSDAVWIINYIFAGGHNPCDTDGDGIPDC